MINVAVYGTLRSGMHNHGRFIGTDPAASLVGTGTVLGYKLIAFGRIPSAVKTGTNDPVVVEVWSISPEIYGDILGMELRAGYVAMTVQVKLSNGSTIEANFFEAGSQASSYLNHPGVHIIPGGDYSTWIKSF